MPAPIIPWSPSNVPIEIQNELDRRKKVRSFNYKENNKVGWTEGGDWSSYKGPLMPWVRVCSNSAGHPARKKPRFVFHGGKGFYQTYGFQPPGSTTDAVLTGQNAPGSNYQIIGYMPTDPPTPHIIENSLKNPTATSANLEQTNFPIHVPTPEISKITAKIQKELFRRVEIEWTCFSWEQLAYMTPYFLIPGISVMVEWGWNHFNPKSLVKLDDETKMQQLWRNAYPLYTKNVIDSKGNYDVLYGIITNFNWSMEGNRINCMTEVTSKDRLYAGISKDMGLTVNDNSDQSSPRPIYQALRDFVLKSSTLLNLKTIAESPNPLSEIVKITGADNYISSSVKGAETQNIIWRDIIRPILSEPDSNVRGMKGPYIRGVFSGRPKKFFNDPIGLGKPHAYDFDNSNVDKLDQSKVWINMGMIVEILNFFSNLDGGAGEPMFQVDILNTVIGAHPNIISCDRKVLIPNRGSPKVHFGYVGMVKYGPQKGEISSPYMSQKVYPQPVNTKADETLRRVCSQIRTSGAPASAINVCYREDLDEPINFLRYKYFDTPPPPPPAISNLGYESYLNNFAFPATGDDFLPASSTGLASFNNSKSSTGNLMEANVSGLLSNIYLNYSAFVHTIEDSDPKASSYVDVYNKILAILNNAVDGFWDLALVEMDNIMTITDKNYIGNQKRLGQNDPTYTFDYYDSDSIIRSLKFRPELSSAQATRTIYGETNNSGSKYVSVDPHDILNYQFKDAIIFNQKIKSQGDPNNDLEKRDTAKQQMKDIIGYAQQLSVSEDDPTLQMTINRGATLTNASSFGIGTGFGGGYVPSPPQEVENGPFEYLKLCLPESVAKQIFRLLIDDKDEDNNPRYCAVQPNIDLELTLQGIGGLRTFQYFLVKNLPVPYSHRDIIFRIKDTTNIISQEGIGWETKITAGLLPLRKYIKNRLTPPIGGWAINSDTVIS